MTIGAYCGFSASTVEHRAPGFERGGREGGREGGKEEKRRIHTLVRLSFFYPLYSDYKLTVPIVVSHCGFSHCRSVRPTPMHL